MHKHCSDKAECLPLVEILRQRMSNGGINVYLLHLSVLLQPVLQPLCIGFSFPQRAKLLFTLLQPGTQTSVFLEELSQLVLQSLRLPQPVLKQTEPNSYFNSKNTRRTVIIYSFTSRRIFILLAPGSSAAYPGAGLAAGPGRHGVAVSLRGEPLSRAAPKGSELIGLSAVTVPAEPGAAEAPPAG